MLTEKTVELQRFESKHQAFQETLSGQFNQLIKSWLLQELDSGSALLFLIKIKDTTIGFAHIRINQVPNEFTKDTVMGEIQSLFIDPENRVKGIGKVAVQFIEQLFNEFNVNYYEVHYVNSNQMAAKFWESCGLSVHSISARKRLTNVKS